MVISKEQGDQHNADINILQFHESKLDIYKIAELFNYFSLYLLYSPKKKKPIIP